MNLAEDNILLSTPAPRYSYHPFLRQCCRFEVFEVCLLALRSPYISFACTDKGSGFSSSSAVTIRNGDLEVPCVVQNATYKRIICKTSPAPSGRDYEGEVVVSER